MKFKYDKETNTLYTSWGYWIPINELSNKDASGRYFWFSHLVQKNWFDEQYANELLDWCKKLGLEVDVDIAKLEMAEDRMFIQQVFERLGGLI
jgi:hypothetical protein